jgi:CheY-like chemotaxis protein
MSTEKKLTVSRYDEAHIRDLLERLDRQDRDLPGSTAAAAATSDSANRGERRWSYARSGINVSIEHPGGGTTRIASHSRCIWGGGIAVLVAAFSYPKSLCTVTLISKDGDLMSCNGVVSACRHVDGALHELEIKFSKRIDPQLFFETPDGSSKNAGEPLNLAMLRGKVLYLDDSELDQRLMAHHLRGSKIDLKFARTPSEALDLLRQGTIDIFFCDFHLGNGVAGTDVVRSARSAGFAGPIVTLTAESSGEKLSSVKAAGSDHVLNKPYQKDGLIELMAKLHQQVGAASSDELIYSSLEDQQEMAELLGGFIASAKDFPDRLQSAITAQDLDSARQLCLGIKGSSIGYGFAALGTAAEEALRTLDGTMSVDESKPKLRALMLMCGRLAIRKAA